MSVVFAQAAPPPALTGLRNRLINGDFAIDQRNSGGAGIAPAGTTTYMLDRWAANLSSPGALYMWRSPSGATGAHAGGYTMVLQPNVADAALAITDAYLIYQNIEGHMMRGSKWGGAYALPITISFICEAAVGGPFTLPLSIRNSALDRSYVTSFTTSANRQSITIPGDVTGTWLFDTGIGLRVAIGLGLGTNYNAAFANAWGTTGATLSAGMSNFMGLTTNQIFLRDFQLELGSVATEFERRPYGTELALCKRYYQRHGGGANTLVWGGGAGGAIATYATNFLEVEMRAVPTGVKAGTWSVANHAQPSLAAQSTKVFVTYGTTVGAGAWYYTADSADDLITLSAEL